MFNVSQKFGAALSVPAKRKCPLLINKEQIFIYIFVSVSSTTTTTKYNNNKQKKKKKKKEENATFVVLAGDFGGWKMNDRQTDILVDWLFGLNCYLRQCFSLYRVVFQREGERKEK